MSFYYTTPNAEVVRPRERGDFLLAMIVEPPESVEGGLNGAARLVREEGRAWAIFGMSPKDPFDPGYGYGVKFPPAKQRDAAPRG